jgi:lysyl-tRNA synthetase class 2
MSPASPWWHASVHADRRPFLTARARIIAALRRHFDREGFLEVEAAALQVSPGNETHLHAFATELISPSGERMPLFLHTSPEFAAKKLLAAGETRIFDFARVFRNRERSALHHPEFTLLEWYRAHQTYERLMDDCAAVLTVAAEAAGTRTLRYRGKSADPLAKPERLSVAEAFARHVGIDLMEVLPPGDVVEPAPASSPVGGGDLRAPAASSRLAAEAWRLDIRVAADDTWSDIFSRVLTQQIEPHLGMERATILFDYPASEAALARRKADDPRLAERFELYACGVELANAFGELTDPEEQRRRFEADMEDKMRIYGESYPIDEDFLAALALMPPAAGIALGLDRLVMLATDASRIEQVIWTPLPEEKTSR